MALLYCHACHEKERLLNKNTYRVDDHLHEKQVVLDYSRSLDNFYKFYAILIRLLQFIEIMIDLQFSYF